MTENWQLVGMNHVNAIVDGYEPSLEHFQRIGLDLSFRIPESGGDGTNAFLMTMAGCMFEFFAPIERGEKANGQGRLLEKFGDHYLGIEFQVPDVEQARQAAGERNVRIINDMGHVFFTYPGSSFGVAWEIWSGDFLQHHKDASYWREHPIGLLGLDHVTIAVNDLAVSSARLQEITDSTVIGAVSRPEAAAEGTRFKAGNIEFEMLQPTGDGPVADYLKQYGERIRSVVWKAADIGKTTSYLNGQGFDTIPGDSAGAIAIDPAQNKNLLFEFTE